jgi:hypothetical protein
MGMFFRSHTASPYIRELCGSLRENFVNEVKGLMKMSIEGIKSQLTEYFNNGSILFNSYFDANKMKQITTTITHPDLNIVKAANLKIYAQENCVTFELFTLFTNDKSMSMVDDTYDSELGKAFIQWFKPILRNIVNEKYELKGDVISDELMGTDYCQIREDGILPFINFSEMVEFTI